MISPNVITNATKMMLNADSNSRQKNQEFKSNMFPKPKSSNLRLLLPL